MTWRTLRIIAALLSLSFFETAVTCFLQVGILSAADIASISPRGEVAADGSFSQRIPLSVPPYHGLEPEVGLEYNSSFGNGMAGWGWRLTGAHVIERVANRAGIPRMDATDDFQLDGNILIPCSRQFAAGVAVAGVSCASGGSHGLERETYQLREAI